MLEHTGTRVALQKWCLTKAPKSDGPLSLAPLKTTVSVSGSGPTVPTVFSQLRLLSGFYVGEHAYVKVGRTSAIRVHSISSFSEFEKVTFALKDKVQAAPSLEVRFI